ncbi:MAG: radical SAM protein [Candidatus Hodarchaeales archaeon]
MKVVARTGNEAIAMVYIGEFDNGLQIEFVESVQPPIPREQKWVLIISTLFGCPVRCKMCDAGGSYKGRLSKEQILEQVDFLVKNRFPNGMIPVKKFKIQFARMGEPALNPAVIDVLRALPELYPSTGLMPSISTIAPAKASRFMEELLKVKQEIYAGGNFQLQFSIHTTDSKLRDVIIPTSKWSFDEISRYGERFWQRGDRKITLNFALSRNYPLEARMLNEFFDPRIFLVKITPLNPTYQARKNHLLSHIDPFKPNARYDVIKNLQDYGYDVIMSIGEVEENLIGSNCGQYLKKHQHSSDDLAGAYSYQFL